METDARQRDEIATIRELLEDRGLRSPAHEAVVSIGRTSRRLGYGDLLTEIRRLGEALLAAGALDVEHSRIGVLIPNSLEYVIAFYAVLSVGGIAVPIHSGLQSKEIASLLADNGITHLIAARSVALRLGELSPDHAPLSVTWASADGFELNDARPNRGRGSIVRHDTPAFSLYSTGSTGVPKRVTRTHAQTVAEIGGIARAFSFGPADRFLAAAPLCHHWGLFNTMLTALMAGGTLVILEEFSPRDVVRIIGEERITSFPGVPYMLRMMSELPLDVPADFSSLRYCLSATAPLPERVRIAFGERFPVYLRQLYGTTEVGVTTVDLDPPAADVAGSVGRSIGGVDLAIVDAEGRRLGPGVEGDVSIRADWAVAGYDREIASGEAFFREGRFHPGDRGVVDESGRLTLTGRTRRFINFAGHKVDPAEVEAALQEHPLVREVAVVGVPDEDRGELVKAVVVTSPGCDRSMLEAYCRERLADYKRPFTIELRSELPRSPVGKLIRRLLIESSEEPATRVASASVADTRKLIDEVSDEVARILGVGRDAVMPDVSFKALGLSSLRAVELGKAIAGRFGIVVPAIVAFDHPTPRAMALYVHDALMPASRAARRAEASTDEPIAIVGIGCRFPGGVTDRETFWDLLSAGVDAVGDMPRDRWNVDALFDPDMGAVGKMVTREGGFIPVVDRFDAAFFGISPREAKSMDPQQRLLLETAWESLEDAGIVPAHLAGTETGVFVGSMYQEYATLDGDSLERRDGYVATGTMASVSSGRISYLLGLQGPSMTVDTACSSSLVAVHLACQSLRRGECALALAGGVTLMLTPSTFVEFSRLGGLAADGRCKSFAAKADGVGWSEGCGMLVLEPLSAARRHGHEVLGLIRGSAVNQDGRSSGLTVPKGPAQAAVIRRALGDASLAPADVQYVECHGTGTILGDPIEVTALGGVLSGRGDGSSVRIGSVKTNIGHTQAAAGVAGVIKTLLALEHETIPKNLHFDAGNPHVAWDSLPLEVVSEPTAWKRSETPRIAGVSSFGFSGTNAHVIIQEAPFVDDREEGR